MPGSICVARTETVYISRPRKLNLDRAYAAISARTVATAMVPRLMSIECRKYESIGTEVFTSL